MLKAYRSALGWVLRHQPLTLLVTIWYRVRSVFICTSLSQRVFSPAGHGTMGGSIQAAQDISFPAMQQKMKQFVEIVMKDPAVETVMGFAGGKTSNQRTHVHHAEAAGSARRQNRNSPQQMSHQPASRQTGAVSREPRYSLQSRRT